MTTGIRKRGASYEAWVYDKRSKRKIRRTFPTEAAAKSWRADATGAVRRRELATATRTTIGEAWDAWLEGARAGTIRKRRGGAAYKPGVLYTYEIVWKRIEEDLGGCRVSELTRFDVQQLVDRMLGDGLDPSTIRNTLMPLRAIYRQAIRSGTVSVNPTADLELPDVSDGREWSGSPEIARLIIEAVPGGERALWATALYAGLRRGELLALTWEHIDGSAIRVARSWDLRHGFVEPKSKAGIRRVPLPATLQRLLLEHRRQTWAEGFVFGRTADRPFQPTSVQARADKCFQTHGLERATLHTCRHAYRSFLDALDISEARCDRYLGHASTKVGRRYTHEIEGQLVKDAERLEAYLTGAFTGADGLETALLSEI
jgi:integrase